MKSLLEMLFVVLLSLFVSLSSCDEKETGISLTQQSLESLDPQQVKDALQQFLENYSLDINVSELMFTLYCSLLSFDLSFVLLTCNC